MIRKAIPVLTHVDNLSDMKIDMSAQEDLLSKIDENTDNAAGTLTQIQLINGTIMSNTGNTNVAVGTQKDDSTKNTVIGLLKSIANKLS